VYSCTVAPLTPACIFICLFIVEPLKAYLLLSLSPPGGAFIIWEVSTSFVHLRWLMFKLNMADSRLYLVNAFFMIVTFFVSRNVWGVYATYLFWIDTGEEMAHPGISGIPASVLWGYRVCNFALMGLNFWWFWRMISKAVAVVIMGKKASEVPGPKDD
jgi:TLC domain